MKKYFWLILLVITCVPSVAYAHEEVTYERKNRLDNYQTITISQSGSLFYSVTNEIIESVKNLDTNLSFIGRANVGLEKITDQAGNQKLNTKTDYLYSVSIKTIEKDFANFIYPTELADKINNNLIIVSEIDSKFICY